ncbi:MAG: transcriptional regulator [Caldithrix sp.]|nr:transcriptional regulator [Caldithrix sp.]
MAIPEYWREIKHRYKLEAGKCKSCGYIVFPMRLICPKCQNQDFDSINLSREGTLITYSVIRVASSRFVNQAPFAVGIVELKEGVRILSQITDCNINELKSGMKMQVEFRRIFDDGSSGVINYGYKCVPM